MNGIHDMGGMQDMGPVQSEKNEPVFHAAWEGRVLGMYILMGAWRKWTIDAGRYERELIPPDEYLRMSYYQKWFAGFVALLVKRGLITRVELERGLPSTNSCRATPPISPEKVLPVLMKGRPARREVAVAPKFHDGQRVRARNINPTGHTRLPRYARGRIGTIERDHGVFVFPDTNANFAGEKPQHVYSVRFSARELWGEHAELQDAVYVDLWDDYLEPV